MRTLSEREFNSVTDYQTAWIRLSRRMSEYR
jgi:hypothetical protein